MISPLELAGVALATFGFVTWSVITISVWRATREDGAGLLTRLFAVVLWPVVLVCIVLNAAFDWLRHLVRRAE